MNKEKKTLAVATMGLFESSLSVWLLFAALVLVVLVVVRVFLLLFALASREALVLTRQSSHHQISRVLRRS